MITINDYAKRTTAGVDLDIAARVNNHRAAIASLSATTTTRQPFPLVMLAVGDSWFDYPLSGNDPLTFGNNTDVIAQLQTMGKPKPRILNLAHAGDATTEELALPKQKRMKEQLSNRSNWPASGKPDAILFSGGGNDIAGDQFCIFLDYAGAPGATGLDHQRFADALGAIEASYRALFAFRDTFATGVPIFGHCYDYPLPSGEAAPCGIGPWLKPSLDFCGWTGQGYDIMVQAMNSFKTVLQRLATDPTNNFVLIDTLGLLDGTDWANELHPIATGFQKIAKAFVRALREHFTGRI